MLDISNTAKQYLLTNSSPKSLVLKFNNDINKIDSVNLYTGSVNAAGYGLHGELSAKGDIILYCDSTTNWTTNFKNCYNSDYFYTRKYIYVSCGFTMASYTKLPNLVYLAAHYTNVNGYGYGGYTYAVNLSAYLDEIATNKFRLYTRLEAAKVKSINELALYCYDTTGLNIDFGIREIQVQLSDNLYTADELITHLGTDTKLPYLGESIIRQGVDLREYLKADEYIADITKKNIIAESFSLTESLCSQDDIKFGLCESAHFDISVFDRSDKFVNREITPQLKLTDKSGFYGGINLSNAIISNLGASNSYTSAWFNLVVASYDIDKYLTRAIFVNYKYVYCKFKLKLTISENDYDIAYVYPFFNCNCVDVSGGTSSYGLFYSESPGVNTLFGNQYYETESVTSDYVSVTIKFPVDYYNEIIKAGFDTPIKEIIDIKSIQFKFLNSNKEFITVKENTLDSIGMSSKDIQLGVLNSLDEEIPEYSADTNYAYSGKLDAYLDEITTIPLGVFKVSNVATTHVYDTIKKKLTCYDKIVELNNNAANWYTRYMFGLNTSNYTTRTSFEFARQIYSTYFNYARLVGLEKREFYSETKLNTWTYNQLLTYAANIYTNWDSEAEVHKIRYCSIPISNVKASTRYVVDGANYNDMTDAQLRSEIPYEYNEVDSLFRGINSEGSVLITETRTGGVINKYVCNRGDYFLTSPDCVSMTLSVPLGYAYNSGTMSSPVVDWISISEVTTPINLTNGHLRLMYYNWSTKEIFPCDSSITGRDVVRSLLEVCGCFFRLSRKNGTPEFIYCVKGGLYPSTNLYPSSSLYPRAGVTQTIPMAHYISIEQEDYSVQDFGKIQIVKKSTSNDGKSVCEWQYVGKPTALSTYLIDDNIFYCSDYMEYEYGSMSEVSEMLENMYYQISNMGYTPNTTKAIGMPWLECGDRVGLLTKTGGLESFIFRRTISGIVGLKDSYESKGAEFTPEVNNFGY